MLDDSYVATLLVNGEARAGNAVYYRNQYHLNGESGYPMLLPRILEIGNPFSRVQKKENRNNLPLNFLRGIIESSNFSSSFMRTFLLLPSPMTRRVFPQLKSSMHQ